MQKVEIIIPQNDNDGASMDASLESIKVSMCSLFGGYTAFKAEGGWVSDDGKLFVEPVTVLVGAAKDAERAQMILALAQNVLEITDQLAVFVSINGQAQIIE